MRDTKHEPGLKLRGDIWHINKVVTLGGQAVRIRESTGCRTAKEAAIVLNRRIAETRAQMLHGPVTVAPTEHTWSEAAAEYIADLERRGKDSTRALYAVRALLPGVGDLALSHVHQRTIQPWIDAQQGKRSSGTVLREIQVISTVLNFAARVLRDGNTPWLTLAPPRLRAPDWGERQPRPITWGEQDRLIEELPAHLIGPVLFALATGARQAEITTLKWDQNRNQQGMAVGSVWWIPPEIRKASAKKTASQQDGRFMICNRAARTVIDRQRGQDSEWVFPSIKGEGGMYRVNNHGWKTAIKAAGLPIRFHDLRHTFGERAADAGIPLDIRRSLLGHEHRDITLHYSSPGLARLLEEAERIVRPGAELKLILEVA
jgi:integrase